MKSMARRTSLPQLDGRTFITDGGMETTLIFRQGLESCPTSLRPLMPGLNVVGGCCGTDERHIEKICASWIR